MSWCQLHPLLFRTRVYVYFISPQISKAHSFSVCNWRNVFSSCSEQNDYCWFELMFTHCTRVFVKRVYEVQSFYYTSCIFCSIFSLNCMQILFKIRVIKKNSFFIENHIDQNSLKRKEKSSQGNLVKLTALWKSYQSKRKPSMQEL